MINDAESYIADRVAFDLGVRAGLKAAADLVADRAHFEWSRFEAAHVKHDYDIEQEALTRHYFALDVEQHILGIDPANINGRYPNNDIEPEFNPYSDLCFEAEEPIRFCEFCGDCEDVEFKPDPYAADIHNDYTSHWICGNCELYHAGEI